MTIQDFGSPGELIAAVAAIATLACLALPQRGGVVAAFICLAAPSSALAGFATKASFHLGHRSERVEGYESAHLCGDRVYVAYRATTSPESGGFRLFIILTGASEEKHQPRFMRMDLDELHWSELASRASSPPGTLPDFHAGSLPSDAARCEALPIGSPRAGLLSDTLLEALDRADFVVFEGYRALALGRRTGALSEWAFAEAPPTRSVRAWWSYPAFALAFAPAVVFDIVTFPFMLALSLQH